EDREERADARQVTQKPASEAARDSGENAEPEVLLRRDPHPVAREADLLVERGALLRGHDPTATNPHPPDERLDVRPALVRRDHALALETAETKGARRRRRSAGDA